MPNGFHGTTEEWQRLEAPLRRADRIVWLFALRHLLWVSKNGREWIDRSMSWGRRPERLIQMYLHDQKKGTFSLWICASEDRGSERYWKRAFLVEDQPMESFIGELPTLLEAGWAQVRSWSSAQLEFATKLGGGKP